MARYADAVAWLATAPDVVCWIYFGAVTDVPDTVLLVATVFRKEPQAIADDVHRVAKTLRQSAPNLH